MRASSQDPKKWKGTIMRSLAQCILVAGCLAGTAMGASVVQAADQKPADQRATQSTAQWRYTFHNCEWWYWLPSNRWVYWRNNQWNIYDPRTFTYRGTGLFAEDGRTAIYGGAATYGSQAGTDSDNRPFYGHALSDWQGRSLEPNAEVGPFYGHALPSEFFGPWRSRSANRPFYGHAVSSYGY
jgi:hypothetical protein